MRSRKDLAPQVLPRRRLVDPLGHEAPVGGPSCRHGASEQGERGSDVEPAWRFLDTRSRLITYAYPLVSADRNG